MTRLKAYLIHLGISALIFIALAALILFVWYPPPYFADDGGWQGIRIVALVDLVLGPGLTLIVFRPGKPGLRFDLTMIALAQAVALAWGTWSVYSQRPVMVAFAAGELYTLTTEQVEKAGDRAPEVLARATTHPVYAVVRLPEDPKVRRGQILMAGIAGVPVYMMGEHMEPLDDGNRHLVLEAGINVEARARKRRSLEAALEEFRAREPGDLDRFAFVPLNCRYGKRLLILRRDDGRVLGALPA
jgi:hypothetical protein